MDENQAIVTYKSHAPEDANAINDRVMQIRTIQKDIMRKDVHYGVIPGTGNKNTLLKPGAELLLTAFRISVQPQITDLSCEDEIRYRVIANGVHMLTNTLVGCGVGEASTEEEKYKWRGANQKEFDATDKQRRRIKYYDSYDKLMVRTNPADLANTVLKMAKKRAQVDLCLTALAASDVFSQDMDEAAVVDISGAAEETNNPKAQSSAPKRSGGGSGMATEKQIGLIKVRCKNASVRDSHLLEYFGLSDFDQLPFSKVNDALEWIEKNSNA